MVAPSDIAVLSPSRDAELTLTTCNPRFLATSRLVVRAVLVKDIPSGSAKTLASLPERLGTKDRWPTPGALVTTPSVARPATTTPVNVGPSSPPARSRQLPTIAATAPSGPTSTVLASPALTNGGNASSWLAGLGWGALALAAWAETRLEGARRLRYCKLATLIAGTLVCLVPLWFCFENVVRLLPANL